MKQNIGIMGRYARLVTGILALNYAAGSPRKNHLGRNLLASFGAMKVAEGVIGWCPAVELCDKLFTNQGSTSAQPGQGQSTQAKQESSARDTPRVHHTDESNEKRDPDVKLTELKEEKNNQPEKQLSDERAHVEAY